MSSAPAAPPAPDALRAQLAATYGALATVHLNLHARDFWRMRAAKQPEQVRVDRLLHEHTDIQQYVAWHAPDGSHLPGFLRGGKRSLLAALAPALAPAD
jgi:hypothetical protein